MVVGGGESIVKDLAELLTKSIDWRDEKRSLAFSGGLDSTVLLFASSFRLAPCTAGFLGSTDLTNSRDSAAMASVSLHEVVLGDADILRYREIISRIDRKVTNFELGYEIVLAAVLDNVDEVEVVTGQGADEIFYGYRKLLDNPEMDNSLYLERLMSRTIPREKKIAEHFHKKLLTPYLNKEIFDFAASLGRDHNIEGDRNKAVLRNAAKLLGVPEKIAERPKKAAQYGSGVSKSLERLARL